MRPGKRHELIDGEHYVTPSPNTKHQDVSMNLGARGAADLLRYNQEVLGVSTTQAVRARTTTLAGKPT